MKLIKDNLGKVAITVDKDYWNSTKDYDRLVVVQRSSNSYTTYISRKPVPAGTPLTDRNYWIPFSHFQEDYADWTNELQRTLNEYKSSVANAIMFEANKDFIENGVVTTITFSITLAQIPQTNTIIKFYKNNVLVSTATVLPQQFDNTGKYQWTDNTSVESLYKVEVVVNGNTYVGLWKINIAYDFYIGTGVDHVNIISNPNYKHTGLNSLAGNYYLTPSAGDYIYIICINNIVPSNVKLSGFELSIAFHTTTTIDNKEYVVYRSLNTYQAGSFTVTINDISYDNNSYIAHLIEEVQKFNTKAEETEEKVDTIADEETLEVIQEGEKQGKIALKNRPMKRSATTDEVIQKGFVILKEGDDFKEVVESYTDGNVIFEIDYAFDLGGDDVEVNIPVNCTLKFEGGQISNGTLIGSNTSIIGNTYHVFGNGLSFSGEWVVPDIDTDMFVDLSGTNDLQKLFALSSDTVVNTIHIQKYSYDYYVSAPTDESKILIPHANDTLVVDGTIRLLPNSFQFYAIFYICKESVKIKGSGTVYGDAISHTYTNYGTEQEPSTHQWGHIVQLMHNLTDPIQLDFDISGLTLCYATGDGVASASTSNVRIHDLEIHHCRRQGISVIGGWHVNIYGCHIHDIYLNTPLVSGLGVGTDPGAGIDIESNTGYSSSRFVKVDNCYIENCKGGIYVAASNHLASDIEITNNVVSETEIRPFYDFGGKNVLCRGNVFETETYVDSKETINDIYIRDVNGLVFDRNTVKNYTIEIIDNNYDVEISRCKVDGARIRVVGANTFDPTKSNAVDVIDNYINCPYSAPSSAAKLTYTSAVYIGGTNARVCGNIINGTLAVTSSGVQYVKQNLTDIIKDNVINGSLRLEGISSIITNNHIRDFGEGGHLPSYSKYMIYLYDSDNTINVCLMNNVIDFLNNADSVTYLVWLNLLCTVVGNIINVGKSLTNVFYVADSGTSTARGFIDNNKINVYNGVTLTNVGTSAYFTNQNPNTVIDTNTREIIL